MNKDKDHMDTALEPMAMVVVKRVVVKDKTKGFIDEYFEAHYYGRSFRGMIGVGDTRSAAVSDLETKYAKDADRTMAFARRTPRHILIDVDVSIVTTSDCQQ